MRFVSDTIQKQASFPSFLCFTALFSFCVGQTTNLSKFELNWSSKLQDNNEEEEKNLVTRSWMCAFRCLISRPQNLILRSRNQISGKLLLSRKLRYFRGSRFSLCFTPSASPHYSLYQVRFYA